MTEVGEQARRDVHKLGLHYARLGRPEAVANLRAALAEALKRIDAAPHEGLAAPRPYPDMAHCGERWIKVGRYWFGYALSDRPLVVSVLFEEADMPRRR